MPKKPPSKPKRRTSTRPEPAPRASRSGGGSAHRELLSWLRSYRTLQGVLYLPPDAPATLDAESNRVLSQQRIRLAIVSGKPPSKPQKGRDSNPSPSFPDRGLAELSKVLSSSGRAPAGLTRAALLATVHACPLVLLSGSAGLDQLGPLVCWRRTGPLPASTSQLPSLLRAASRAITNSLGHADLAMTQLQQLFSEKGRKPAHIATLERLVEARARDAERDAIKRFKSLSTGQLGYLDFLPMVVKTLGKQRPDQWQGTLAVLLMAVGCVLVISDTGGLRSGRSSRDHSRS